MNNINNKEYNKEVLNLYIKFYGALNRFLEFYEDIKREEAAGLILEEIFGNEYKEEMTPFRKNLKTNILLFFAKGMTVYHVEKMLLE